MAVELELPTIHGNSGNPFDHFTKDGIAFDQSTAESNKRYQQVIDPELIGKIVEGMKQEYGEDLTPTQAAELLADRDDRRRDRSFYGHILREGQEILAASQTLVEAKARLVETRHYYLRTFDPGEVLSIIGYYGSKINKDPFNWLAISAREESIGRLAYWIRHIDVLIGNATTINT